MIAIPNMEMPKSCRTCPLNSAPPRGCLIWTINDIREDKRNKDCPLIEIVRCGECKQLDHTKWCDLFLHYMNEDDFCSYGERRADEHNTERD